MYSVYLQLIKNDDESTQLSASAKHVLEACSQIVDCLVDRLLTLEEAAVRKYQSCEYFHDLPARLYSLF